MNTIKLFPTEIAVLAGFEPDESLNPFLKQRPVALLPLLGKPIIHHWLDALSNVGVRQLVVLLTDFPEQVRAYVGKGERWGFDGVEYISTSALQNWTDVKAKLADGVAEEAAFCSLNAVPSAPLNRMKQSEAFWFAASKSGARNDSQAVVINSPFDLWAANMVLCSELNTTKQEPGSFIDAAIRLEGKNHIAERVVIEGQNKITDSVIGKDVHISEACELDQAVVMSDTHLGSHLKISRKIIDGPMVYDVETGCMITVDDPRLSARLTRVEQTVGAGERMLAFVLLLLTAPMTLRSRKQQYTLSLVQGESFDGETISRDINLATLVTESRFARRIPWLMSVVKGEVPLFGIREQGQTVSERPGVISLADFGDQSEVGITIANSYQTHTKNLSSNLALAVKWLPRAMTRK